MRPLPFSILSATAVLVLCFGGGAGQGPAAAGRAKQPQTRSQGASIIPLTAVRSPDVAFLIAVSGCLSFDRQMYYYRANLFRQRELPDSLLDIANKASLVGNDFARRVRNGLPVPAAWRARCA